MRNRGINAMVAAVVLGFGGVGGCVAAAAGAGAAGGIYLTSRGAESLLNGSTDEAINRARTAFQDMNITEAGYSTDKGGDEQTLKGTSGNLEINVEAKRDSPNTTKVEVTAKKNAVQYDKDYAKQVLSKIVGK